MRATTLLITAALLASAPGCGPAFPTGVVTTQAPLCPEGEHDLGDGSCGPEGTCLERFTLLPEGRCAGFLEIGPPLEAPSFGHSLTMLPNGRLLLAGGFSSGSVRDLDSDFGAGDSGGVLTRARIFNPRDDTWSEAPELPGPRYQHVAFPAHPIGVHVIGGLDSSRLDQPPAESFVYDPRRDAWDTLPGLEGADPDQPARHLTPLQDGRLLLLYSASPDAALIDPHSGTLTPLPPLPRPRSSFTLLRQRSGHILVIGGWAEQTPSPWVDRLDPDTLTWTELPDLRYARGYPAAVELEDGGVLVIGGQSSRQPVPWVERLDPGLGAWEEMPMMHEGRAAHTATRLDDGRVLVIGGSTGDAYYDIQTLDTAELFDPVTRLWTRLGPLVHPRRAHTATPLPDGRVLLVGGVTDINFGPVPVVEAFTLGR